MEYLFAGACGAAVAKLTLAFAFRRAPGRRKSGSRPRLDQLGLFGGQRGHQLPVQTARGSLQFRPGRFCLGPVYSVSGHEVITTNVSIRRPDGWWRHEALSNYRQALTGEARMRFA